MYPWPADNANSQHPAQAYPHRSLTDGSVAPNHPSINPPNPRALRSASFSASRSSVLQNWNAAPPPPVPPLPPSLLPGFRSPPLAHSGRDTFFVETPSLVQSPQPWTHPPIAGPGNPMFSSVPIQWGSTPGPPAPPMDPASRTGMYTNEHAHTEAEAATVPIIYAPKQHSYIASPPPPAIPPRPLNIHDNMRTSDTSFAPAVPPKPIGLMPSTPLKPAPPPLPAKDWLSTPHAQSEALGRAQESHPSLPNPHSTALSPESYHSRTHSAEDIARAIELSLEETKRSVSVERRLQDNEDRDVQQSLADSLATSLMLIPPDAEVGAPEKLSGRSSTQLEQTPPLTTEFVGEAVSGMVKNVDGKAEAKELSNEQDGDVALRGMMEQEEQRLLEEKREIERKDEEVARQHADEQGPARKKEQYDQERRDAEIARQQSEKERAQSEELRDQELRDAELARRLASAGEAGPSHFPNPVRRVDPITPTLQGSPVPISGAVSAREASSQPRSDPPLYEDVVAPSPVITSKQAGGPLPSKMTIQSSSSPTASTPHSLRGRATSTVAAITVPPPERPNFSRASTVGIGAIVQAAAPRQQTDMVNDRTPSRMPLPPHVVHPSTMSGPAPARKNETEPLEKRTETVGRHSQNVAGPSNSSVVPTLQDQHVDHELLRGVSFGFEPPRTPLESVQHSQLPPSPPFPEVITLYLAPERPFHIMALSWRHMMRLLAQFETRIEASVSIIATAKQEPILRVVIQFVKLPFTSNEWRTIIHLSIDQPVPQNMPRVWSFTSGDTTVLPYSVALGQTPPYLKISAHSHVYTVPLSPTTPFPTLPLALPNLALYLQSAMRDSRSRRVQNDTTNTIRRLARIVSSCYPEEVPNAEPEERDSGRGMGGLFKRVVGRGTPKRQESQGNEDVYDMVTPFRIDKYTAVHD